MIYLSGAIDKRVPSIPGTGYMLTMNMGNRPNLTSIPWACDTGCFSKPESYSLDRYLTWIRSHAISFSTCLFATAPDVFGSAELTLDIARPHLAPIRRLVRVAFVAQPGAHKTPIPWSQFDCLFIGGPDHWQFSDDAFALVDEANRRGKWVHRGRVNSLRKLWSCVQSGVDSADGTYVAFGPDRNIRTVAQWMRRITSQEQLPVVTTE